MIPGITASGGDGAWTPLELPNLFAWFDVSNPAGVIAAGSPLKVSQLTDLSGNGNHAVQANGTFQFSLDLINGLDAIRASARGPYMTFPPLSTDGPVAMYAVGQTVNTAGSPSILGSATGPAGTLSYNATGLTAIFEVSTTRVVIVTENVLSPNVVGGEHDGTTARLYWNGAEVGSESGGSAPSGLSFSVIGYKSPDALYDFVGYCGEIVMCASVLTTDQRDALSDYLRTKWGTP